MRDKDTSPADHLRDYFTHDIGPVLNYSALETQLGAPHKTLRYWAKSTYPRPLPEIHREKVLRWARQHGYSETIQYGPLVWKKTTADAAKKIIKEGSYVEVLVNHMDGMKGSAATVKSYSIPAMLSDITMKDGMKMPNHKWLTNDEVKLK